jgi:hypothetical protein
MAFSPLDWSWGVGRVDGDHSPTLTLTLILTPILTLTLALIQTLVITFTFTFVDPDTIDDLDEQEGSENSGGVQRIYYWKQGGCRVNPPRYRQDGRQPRTSLTLCVFMN